MGSLLLDLKLDEKETFDTNLGDAVIAQRLSQLFKDLSSKNKRANVNILSGTVAPVAASATLTLASVIATDQVIIGPTTFTFTSTPSSETDVEVDGATDADDATALAAAINAHSTVGEVVVATATAAVVTVTARVRGVAGNFINISSPDATITASAAHLGSGAGSDDTPVNINAGLSA
jgi:phage tail sheath gpL-like